MRPLYPLTFLDLGFERQGSYVSEFFLLYCVLYWSTCAIFVCAQVRPSLPLRYGRVWPHADIVQMRVTATSRTVAVHWPFLTSPGTHRDCKSERIKSKMVVCGGCRPAEEPAEGAQKKSEAELAAAQEATNKEQAAILKAALAKITVRASSLPKLLPMLELGSNEIKSACNNSSLLYPFRCRCETCCVFSFFWLPDAKRKRT